MGKFIYSYFVEINKIIFHCSAGLLTIYNGVYDDEISRIILGVLWIGMSIELTVLLIKKRINKETILVPKRRLLINGALSILYSSIIVLCIYRINSDSYMDIHDLYTTIVIMVLVSIRLLISLLNNLLGTKKELKKWW